MVSEPAKARVSIDGQVRCATPCTLDAPAPPAATLVEIDRDGYLPWIELVVPSADGMKVKLRREPSAGAAGQVSFKTGERAGQNVLIGGKPIGYATTAAEPLTLAPGEQVLELQTPGSDKSSEIKVVVKAGQTTDVDLTAP